MGFTFSHSLERADRYPVCGVGYIKGVVLVSYNLSDTLDELKQLDDSVAPGKIISVTR